MNQVAIATDGWRAIARFQHRYSTERPNSFKADTADHAISLFLNRASRNDRFAARNAWRDAGSVVLRRHRRNAARYRPLPETDHESDAAISSDVLQAMADPAPTPEQALVWTDQYQRLRTAVSDKNAYAARCLDDWRDGYSEDETAAALCISRDYVKKLRALVKKTARGLLCAEG